VIAKLLENPEPYFGKRVPLLGPNRGSWQEHYEIASRVVGKEIRYVHVPIETWAQNCGIANQYTVSHLSGMTRHYNNGGMDWDPKVSQLDQFIPREQQTTVEQFFEKNKELFGKQGLQLIYGITA